MTYAETTRFLFSLGPELKAIKWDLARIEALLGELGDPHRRGRFLHVAGTNGKGSTCAMMAAALRSAGCRTGLYTSPHLADARERIQIDGQPIAEPAWVAAFESVNRAAESLLAQGSIRAHPSFFETVTAMAFLAFAEAGLDVVVLETGLGGRLDATNAVMPELAVITPIDFDHEAFLGSGLESIASEKAGIIKPRRPVVVSEQRPEAMRVLERRALELQSGIVRSSDLRIERLQLGKSGSRFRLQSCTDSDFGIRIDCPLAGEHQVENARTCVAALRLLGVAPSAIAEGIAKTAWPGRLERVSAEPDVILDGAHNPAGARALAAYIRRFFSEEPVRIIYGAMRDKAVDEVTNTLFPLATDVIVTAPNQARALNPEALAVLSDDRAVRTAANLEAAIEMAGKEPMATFVTGSLFLVGEARALYQSRQR